MGKTRACRLVSENGQPIPVSTEFANLHRNMTVQVNTISDPESDLNNMKDFVYAPELGKVLSYTSLTRGLAYMC
jgi:hypothetical protein